MNHVILFLLCVVLFLYITVGHQAKDCTKAQSVWYVRQRIRDQGEEKDKLGIGDIY